MSPGDSLSFRDAAAIPAPTHSRASRCARVLSPSATNSCVAVGAGWDPCARGWRKASLQRRAIWAPFLETPPGGKAERPRSSYLYHEAGTGRLNPQLEFGCAASRKVTLKHSGVGKQPGLKSCLRKGPVPSKQCSNQVDLATSPFPTLVHL